MNNMGCCNKKCDIINMINYIEYDMMELLKSV